MCDNDFVKCDIPVMAHMSASSAWDDFIADPGDWERFDRFDWFVRVFAAKWGAYAMHRRIEASCEHLQR